MANRFSLIGIDGNAFAVMGYVASCMKKVGYSKSEIDSYHQRATSSDYNNLLFVSQEQIEECNSKL